ncbi:phage tail protein [Pseudomonas sp. NA-150]|uniref:phage tail protein n=1 Tax=Pseudomonas sp. NA-150 TaxID=3367525 RepID=UPI0037C9D8AE
MPYMDQLQSSFKYLVEAGETGRRNIDGMLGPLNSAIGDVTGAAGELGSLPGVPPEMGAKLQRMMRAINAAESKLGTVLNTYSQATRALSGVEGRVDAFKAQASNVAAAINQIAGQVSPSLANILPTGLFTTAATPLAEAVKPFPHLLIMQPLGPNTPPYYFNLDTAAFDELRRQTDFRWASQERLSRRPARQGIGPGDDKITLKGAIYPSFKGGLEQLNTLRRMGTQLEPLSLTTGFGVVLGTWCLSRLEEEQSALLQGGIPRKQSFTLEFSRYGDDMQNV